MKKCPPFFNSPIFSQMRKIFSVIAFFLLSSVVACGQAKNQATLSPVGLVNDFAGVLPARTKIEMEETLRQFSRNEGLEIAVVTVKTTGNISIFDYSLSLANSWKVGSKTKPSYGMLLLAAVDDRRYHTQITRDAEEIFSNEWLDATQKQLLAPEFQKGDFGTGLSKTIDAYLKKFEDFRSAKKRELDRKFQIFEPNQLLAQSLQAVVVQTKDWNSFQGTARLFERPAIGGGWTPKGESFPVVVGKNGLAWSEDVVYLLEKKPPNVKREGDGRAPAGVFDLTYAFGSGERPAFVKLPFTRLEESTECVDDPNSSSYNRIVDRLKIGNFDWNSSEKMLAVGAQYDLGVFVAHNSDPVKTGNGSCIFLHIWKNENSSTAGCTAMKRENIETILGWLEKGKNPVLIQFPAPEYEKLRESWELPAFP